MGLLLFLLLFSLSEVSLAECSPTSTSAFCFTLRNLDAQRSGVQQEIKTEQQIVDQILAEEQAKSEPDPCAHFLRVGFCTECRGKGSNYEQYCNQQGQRLQQERSQQQQDANRDSQRRQAAANEEKRKAAERQGGSNDTNGGANDNANNSGGSDKNGDEKLDHNNPNNQMGAAPMNPALAQQTPKQSCDYEGSTKIRQVYEEKKRKCDKYSRDAVRACDGAQNAQIKQALAGAQEAAALISKAKGKSQLAACDKFSDASNKLKDSLKNYQQTCMPAKAKCENSCTSYGSSSGTMGGAIKTNPNCYSKGDSYYSQLKQRTLAAKRSFDKCKSFEKTLDQTQNDVNQLVNSIERSGLCQKMASESCRLDPTTGDCQRQGYRDSGLSLLDTAGSGGGDMDNLSNEVDPEVLADSRAESLSGASYEGFSGGGFSGSHKAGLGPEGARGHRESVDKKLGTSTRGSNGKYGRFGNRRSGKYRNSRFKKGRFGGAGYSSGGGGGKSRKTASAGSGDGNGLEQFLPGGSRDPNKAVLFKDGITAANGPSIFEKISRRYNLHRRSLLD